MDVEPLRAEIGRAIGCEVGLRWRKITLTTKKSRGPPVPTTTAAPATTVTPTAPTQALHVEVDFKNFDEAKSKLHEIYASNNCPTNMLWGIRMRLIPPVDGYANVDSITKAQKARAQHEKFNAAIQTKETDIIAALHAKMPKLGKSVRDLLAELTILKGTWNRPIFHTVDLRYGKEDAVVFSWCPDMANEATAAMQGIYRSFVT